MNTYKLLGDSSQLRYEIINILMSTSLFYKFESIEWSQTTYLHIEGYVSTELESKLSNYFY